MSSTYLYRLLKSSWGIRISITASIEKLKGLAPSVGAESSIDVRFAGRAESLPDDLKGRIRKGFSIIEDEVVEACGGAAALVTIEDISYNEADFQAEGLEIAAIRWAEQELGLPQREIVEVFNKEENKYLFAFPEI